MNPGDNQTGSLTQDEAVTRLTALLGADDSDTDELEEGDGENAQDEEDEDSSDDSDGETDADDDGEDDEAPQAKPGQLITVKVDGEELQVPLEELKNGYQRQADYTRKSMALAEQRKAVAAEVQQTRVQRDQFIQASQTLLQQMQQMAPPEPDWAKLRQEDPIGFGAAWADHQMRQQQRAFIQQQHNHAVAQAQRDEELRLAQTVSEEAQLLAAAVPDFGDEEKGSKLKSDLLKFGKTMGFRDEELSQVYDHRTVLVLHKAMLYDRMQRQKPSLRSEITQKRMAPPVASPGAKQAPPDGRRAVRRLAQTGHVRDAAAAIERML